METKRPEKDLFETILAMHSNVENVGTVKSLTVKSQATIKPTPPPLRDGLGLCLKIYPGGVKSLIAADVSVFLVQVSVIARMSIECETMESAMEADLSFNDLAFNVAATTFDLLQAVGPGLDATSPASKRRNNSFTE